MKQSKVFFILIFCVSIVLVFILSMGVGLYLLYSHLPEPEEWIATSLSASTAGSPQIDDSMIDRPISPDPSERPDTIHKKFKNAVKNLTKNKLDRIDLCERIPDEEVFQPLPQNPMFAIVNAFIVDHELSLNEQAYFSVYKYLAEHTSFADFLYNYVHEFSLQNDKIYSSKAKFYSKLTALSWELWEKQEELLLAAERGRALAVLVAMAQRHPELRGDSEFLKYCHTLQYGANENLFIGVMDLESHLRYFADRHKLTLDWLAESHLSQPLQLELNDQDPTIHWGWLGFQSF